VGLELARAFVSVRADTSRLSSDIKRAKDPLKKALDHLTNTVRGFLATLGIGVSIAKAFSIARESLVLWTRELEAQARVAALVRTTGMAAGFTAKELRDMADEFQAATTTGNEAILELMARMLTFKSVSKEVFRDAIEVALDTAAVMGTDVRSAAIQLGMALEDPSIGLTRLRRSGISFSEAEKERIKQLQRAGKLHEAQAETLRIVRNQLGGVAKELAKLPVGRVKQLDNLIGDVKEQIGKYLVPMQLKWRQAVLSTYEAIEKVVATAHQFPSLTTAVLTFAGAVGTLGTSVAAYRAAVRGLPTVLKVLGQAPPLLAVAGVIAAGAAMLRLAEGFEVDFSRFMQRIEQLQDEQKKRVAEIDKLARKVFAPYPGEFPALEAEEEGAMSPEEKRLKALQDQLAQARELEAKRLEEINTMRAQEEELRKQARALREQVDWYTELMGTSISYYQEARRLEQEAESIASRRAQTESLSLNRVRARIEELKKAVELAAKELEETKKKQEIEAHMEFIKSLRKSAGVLVAEEEEQWLEKVRESLDYLEQQHRLTADQVHKIWMEAFKRTQKGLPLKLFSEQLDELQRRNAELRAQLERGLSPALAALWAATKGKLGPEKMEELESLERRNEILEKAIELEQRLREFASPLQSEFKDIMDVWKEVWSEQGTKGVDLTIKALMNLRERVSEMIQEAPAIVTAGTTGVQQWGRAVQAGVLGREQWERRASKQRDDMIDLLRQIDQKLGELEGMGSNLGEPGGV